jgi:hypothetical protein
MRTKPDQMRSAWAADDRIGALRIAARFFDRSDATMTFQRGMDAYNHPDFYRQLGKEPRQIVTAALELLAGGGHLFRSNQLRARHIPVCIDSVFEIEYATREGCT